MRLSIPGDRANLKIGEWDSLATQNIPGKFKNTHTVAKPLLESVWEMLVQDFCLKEACLSMILGMYRNCGLEYLDLRSFQ